MHVDVNSSLCRVSHYCAASFEDWSMFNRLRRPFSAFSLRTAVSIGMFLEKQFKERKFERNV